jgi:hypothetical protein
LAKSFFDLLIGFVLAQCVHRPNGCRKPSDDGQLQNQANDASDGATYREKRKPRQKQGDDQTHVKILSKNIEDG